MNVTIELFTYAGDHRRVNKNIDETHPLATITANTSDNTSIINPIFEIDYAATRIDFNYAIIPTFNDRRYFVTPELFSAHRMLLNCYFDPYSSYALEDVEGYVKRSGNASGRVIDKSVPIVNGQVDIRPYSFPKSPYKWSYVQPSNNTKENFYIVRTR